jgi:AcrR family transcriptional regulator
VTTTLPPNRPTARSSTHRPAAERLKSELATLVRGTGEQGLTVAELCRRANVSRNSLYRYHPDVLDAVRRHRARGCQDQTADVVKQLREEIDLLRQQGAKLAALVDHYYTAYREAKGTLDRRERELAGVRQRLEEKPTLLRP